MNRLWIDDRWLLRMMVVLTLILCMGSGRAYGVQSEEVQSPHADTQKEDGEIDTHQRAVDTLRYLASLVGAFRNPEQQIIGYAVIGEAWSSEDRAKASEYFRQAYALLQKLQATEEDSGPLEARAAEARNDRLREVRTELLSRIQRVNPALARELTRIRDEKPTSVEPDLTRPQRRRANQRLQAATLMAQANQRLETDPAAALALAQQSLALGISPSVSTFLARLHMQDPALADRLFEAAFAAATRTLPPVMEDLMALAPYVFPSMFQGRQQRPTDPARAQLFLQALAMSLLNAPWLDNPSGDQALYSQAARQYLTLQRMLPLYQRFAPNLIDDLHQILDQAMSSVPGRFQNKLATASNPGDPVEAMTRNAENETDPRLRDELYAQAALVAAGKGDMDRAEQLTQRIVNSQLRQQTDEQITYAGAQAAIEQEQWGQLRKLASATKDPLARPDLLIQAADRLIQKKQPEQALRMLNEAYSVLTPLDSSEEKARYLFSIATIMVEIEPLRTFEVAQAGVMVLNKLIEPTKEAEKSRADQGVPLTPKRIRLQLETTFSRLARADFERTIQVATQLQNLEQRVVAQAVSCQALLSHVRTAQPGQEP